MRIPSLFVAAAVAMAASGGAVILQHGGAMGDHFKMIARHLNLTPIQEKKLRSSHEEVEKKVAAIEADEKLDDKAKGEARAKLHEEMKQKAKAVLTAGQWKDMEVLHKAMSHQQEAMHILGQLDLSKEQKDEIHKLMLDTTSSALAIHRSRLSDAQKAEKSRQLHTEAIQKIHGILTPAQIEKAKSLHHAGDHGARHAPETLHHP